MDFVELEGGEGHLQHTGSLIVVRTISTHCFYFLFTFAL